MTGCAEPQAVGCDVDVEVSFGGGSVEISFGGGRISFGGGTISGSVEVPFGGDEITTTVCGFESVFGDVTSCGTNVEFCVTMMKLVGLYESGTKSNTVPELNVASARRWKVSPSWPIRKITCAACELASSSAILAALFLTISAR